MAQSLTNFDNALKTDYIGPIRRLLSERKVLLFGFEQDESKIPQGSRPFNGITADAEGISYVGSGFVMPFHYKRNSGVGSRAERAKLPTAGSQAYQQLSDTLTYYYGRIELSGQVIRLSESQEGAFARAMTEEMEGVMRDLKMAMNEDAMGGDGTGALATIDDQSNDGVDTTRYLNVGYVVDAYDSGLSSIQSNGAAMEIATIDRDTGNLTFVGSPSYSATNGDILVRASSNSTSGTPNNSLNTAVNGLPSIVDSSGTLHNVDPSTYPVWKSTETAAGGDPLDEDYLRDLCDDIGYVAGVDDGLVFLTTRGVRNDYVQSLRSMKRFNDAEAVTLRGGFRAIMFDDTEPMVVDDHCPNGTLFAVDLPHMFWAQASDWEWLDKDGAVLSRVADEDAYEATIFKYCQLGTSQRQRHGKITGLNDSSSI